MSYQKCLVDIEKDENRVVNDFSKLHDDFAHWVNTREDGLSIPTLNIIKYIVLCYDAESPVVKEHSRRWTLKKREAAKISGILLLKGLTQDTDIEHILYCKNSVINKITVKYLYMLSDRDFLMYAIYNEMLISQSTQVLSADFDKPADLARAKENIEIIQKDITILEQKLFSGDDVRALKNILQEEARKFLVTELRPENLVSKHEKGEQVIQSPYGEDYKPDKLRFLDDR
jgi:hypothetical protein